MSQKTNKKQPSLWKLAGCRIKKYSIGKVVLEGIGGGIDSAKHKLAFGLGGIDIKLLELKVYQKHEKVEGVIHMNLTKPLEAKSLKIALTGHIWRASTTNPDERASKIRVYERAYTVYGKYNYPCKASFLSEVLIPQLKNNNMSSATKSTLVGSVITAVRSIQASKEPPIEWSLAAKLNCASTLFPLCHSIRIYVAEEKY